MDRDNSVSAVLGLSKSDERRIEHEVEDSFKRNRTKTDFLGELFPNLNAEERYKVLIAARILTKDTYVRKAEILAKGFGLLLEMVYPGIGIEVREGKPD